MVSTPPIIAIVNHSTLVTQAQAQTMTNVVASQVYWQAAPGWRRAPSTVRFYASESLAPAGSWVIGILDDADQAGDLGWHTEDSTGRVYGRVFAKPAIDAGYKVLDGPYAVSTTLSHEVLETFGDPNANGWADNGSGELSALELCDAVESDWYELTLGSGEKAAVSNFLLPDWFDPQAPAGRQFDWMKHCTAPFQMTKGGYVVVMAAGKESQQFGERFPDWKKATKFSELSRMSRRVAEAPGRLARLKGAL